MVTPTRRRLDSKERIAADMAAGGAAPYPAEAVYPVAGGVPPLSAESVAVIAGALADSGWPVVRSEADYLRLVVALRWMAWGTTDEVRAWGLR